MTKRLRSLGPIVLCIALVVASACGSTKDEDEAKATGSTRPGAPGSSSDDATDDGAANPDGESGTDGDTGEDGAEPGAGSSGPGASGSPRAQTGVTGPLTIGVETLQSADAASDAAGVKGSSVGNMQVQAQVVIDSINAAGGVDGHPLVPVFYDYSSPFISATDEQAACSFFTEDKKVFAVLTIIDAHEDPFFGCMASRNTPVISEASVVDDVLLEQSPLLVVPGKLGADRAATTYISGLHEQGFFGDGAKVGLFRYDTPLFTRVAKDHLKPALAKIGVKLTEEAAVNPSSIDAMSAATSNAVLRFKAAGVNRVIFLARGGLASGLFMFAAEAQAYRPTYGVSSNDGPEQVKQNVPASQFEGLVGVGWAPFSGDVDGSQQPAKPDPAKRCIDMMRKAGQTAEDVNGESQQLLMCDTFWLFQAALTTSRAFTAEGIVAGARELGKGYASPLTFATDFTRRRDGVAAAQSFFYEKACACLKYRPGAPKGIG